MSTIVRSETARALVDARARDSVLETYPGPIPRSAAEAYAVQDEATVLRGEAIAGWKLGRVGKEHVADFGAPRLTGPIFADQVVRSESDGTAEMPVLRGFAAVEAELLLRVERTVPSDVALKEVPGFIAEVRFGLEIASSPLPFINERGPAVTASDFGNNFGLLIGPRLDDWQMPGALGAGVTMAIDGERVGEGCATAILDGPFGAVAFLAAALAKRGRRLEAGSWVSAGAITGVHPIAPGQSVEAIFDERLTVSCCAVSLSPIGAR